MKNSTKEWLPTAQAMRREGHTTAEVAAAVGITPGYLRLVEAGFYHDGVPDEDDLRVHHQYRTPVQKLVVGDERTAILKRYTAGEITRQEMSRQLWKEAA